MVMPKTAVLITVCRYRGPNMTASNQESLQLVSPSRALPPRGVGLLAFGTIVTFMIYQVTVENAFAPLQSEMAAELAMGSTRSAVVSASVVCSEWLAATHSRTRSDGERPC